MKSLTLIVSIVLIVVNILAGVILKDYHTENVIMSTCVLVANAALLWIVAKCNMKDAFKVSYHILFSFLCLVEFILSLVAPNRWENNYYLIGIICCFAFQIILFIVALLFSQHNK